MSMFPETRLRRLRKNESVRRMFDIPLPAPQKFIWPVFVVGGNNLREPISSMPGQYRFSADMLCKELDQVLKDGIGGVLIFGVLDEPQKDDTGKSALAENGIVPNAVRMLRKKFPALVIVSDVCLCAYTNHGHCGILDSHGEVDNDATNEILAGIAVCHAKAGADIVAPSAMMDGQVRSIRKRLDEELCHLTLIMSYSTKFASAMYGPFREAEQSVPRFGDRRAHQCSYSDQRLALRESVMDEEEGADILMVKPSLFYLDVVARLRERTDLPLAAFNVSGEYSMLIAAAEKGWGDLRSMVRESTTAILRAGADIIISYWANQFNRFFKDPPL